jgi:ribose-phosphate pyrophosphokinase
MKTVIANLFGDNQLTATLAKKLHLEIADIDFHQFPDGETYLKINTPLQGKNFIINANLYQPNNNFLPLLFTADTARELGATKIGLSTPYLPYMRQDKQFHDGEGVTSKYFAKIISSHFDWLITMDPHLHRYHDLSEIYTIPNTVLHAAPLIAAWIADNINDPLLIGPDSESEQWVRSIAEQANAPYIVLEKLRRGDHDVEVSSNSEFAKYLQLTPVLVDDIISTASTMIKTVENIHQIGMKSPVCIGIHALFAADAFQKLKKAGVADIISCNTIEHQSNQIDISDIFSDAFTTYC